MARPKKKAAPKVRNSRTPAQAGGLPGVPVAPEAPTPVAVPSVSLDYNSCINLTGDLTTMSRAATAISAQLDNLAQQFEAIIRQAQEKVNNGQSPK